MSNKDNWDDESGDEEELDPILKEGGLMRFNLNALESEAPNEAPNEEEEPNEEDPPDEGVVGGTPLEEDGHPLEEYPDDEWGGEGGDPLEDDDYEDELDDYDKKLGRYVSCR